MSTCVFCRSPETYLKKQIPYADLVVVKQRCMRCRREVVVWSGTVSGYRRWSRDQRRLKRAAAANQEDSST